MTTKQTQRTGKPTPKSLTGRKKKLAIAGARLHSTRAATAFGLTFVKITTILYSGKKVLLDQRQLIWNGGSTIEIIAWFTLGISRLLLF